MFQGDSLGWAAAGRWNPRARFSPEPYATQFILTAVESTRDFSYLVGKF